MSSEQIKFRPENIGDCLEGRGITFKLIGNVPEDLYSHPISTHLDLIISELTDNCADKGAKVVSILSKFGGDLKYYAKDGHIITELFWN